jgi:tetratricopeptide (TPR) repeat protein
MLTLMHSPDGPHFAERAMEIFPACYPLALLGAETLPPADVPGVLLRILDRHAASITKAEKPAATTAFRQSILKAFQAAPSGPEVIALLRRACEVFPESARLAGELGQCLYRAGELDEACLHQARALALWRQAAAHKEEFATEEAAPWNWQLAEHIQSAK